MSCECRAVNGETSICDSCASSVIEATRDADAVELVPGMLASGERAELLEAVSGWLASLGETGLSGVWGQKL